MARNILYEIWVQTVLNLCDIVLFKAVTCVRTCNLFQPSEFYKKQKSKTLPEGIAFLSSLQG